MPEPESTQNPSPRGERPLRILVTGGGTGGHTTPAVATIHAIEEILGATGNQGEWKAQFLYLGSRHGVERKVALEIGVEFVGIETGKLRRSRSLLGLLSLANIKDAMRVPIGYAQALGAVRKFRPDVVLSTGGYVSVPGVLAASALGIPIVAHEQTVQVGLANRMNFKVASVIALSVDETLEALSPALKARAMVVGNPVRDVIFGGDPRRAAGLQFGFEATDELQTVYVTGGAQGSRLINRAVEDCLANLLEFCRIIHQCGAQAVGSEQDFDRLTSARAALTPEKQARYAVTKYVGPEIGDVYALASLIIGRSGAGTITEVCALGKPALFVPLVPTGGDEQTRNAERLVKMGAAQVVKQDALNGESLLTAVQSMLSDPVKLSRMGEKARTLAMPDAAMRLAEAVIEQGKRRAGPKREKGPAA